jgi:hypothetical protein
MTTASSVPSCVIAVNVAPGSKSAAEPGSEKNRPTSRRWALDERVPHEAEQECLEEMLHAGALLVRGVLVRRQQVPEDATPEG